MDIFETIKARRSTRNYCGKLIEEAHKRAVQAELAKLSTAYRVRLALLKNEFHSKQFGTYGVIKHPVAFLAAVCPNTRDGLLDAGAALEKAVLLCTSLGLGSCWLGGCFKRDEFGSTLTVGEGELIPAVVSVGYPAEKEGLLGSVMRWGAKSDQRKPFEGLFFDGCFGKPLQLGDDDLNVALEMVRLGPSASNKQPWRAVRTTDAVHFYIAHTPGYAKMMPFDMQMLDLGIAMAHFELAAQAKGIVGGWKQVDPCLPAMPQQTEYLRSWVCPQLNLQRLDHTPADADQAHDALL